MIPITIYNIPEPEKGAPLENGKWLLIALAHPPESESKILLEKICAALNADPDKDAYTIVITDEDSPPIPHDIRLVLSFGVEPSRMGIHMDLENQGIRFLEPFTFILTGTLEELSVSAPLKKQLWSCMQDFLEENKAS